MKLRSKAWILAFFPLAAGAATISGTVTGRAGTGPSMALDGATVILIDASGGAHLDSTATDSAGQYTLTDSTSGARQVEAEFIGYTSVTGNVMVTNDMGRYTLNLSLTAVPAPGKISGVVKDSSNQQVLAGAQVILSRTGGLGAGGSFAPETLTTNAQGQYVFDSLAANSGYALNATATGFQALTRTGITVGDGQTVTENLALLPIPTPGSIAGTVTNRVNQQALSGARVILTPARGIGIGGVTAPDTLTTDAQGHFTFDSLAVSTGYSLTVTDSGFQMATQTGVAVTSGSVTTENLSLVPNGVTSGALVGAVLIGASQQPVANAQVIVTPARGIGIGGGVAPDTLTTNAQGQFLEDSLPASNTAYTVTVTAAGFQREVKSATILAAATDTLDFLLVDTAAANRGSVNGLVLGGAQPLAAARVVLSSLGGGGTVHDTVHTDAQGYYVIPDLAAGNYTVTVADSGYQNVPATTTAVTAGETSEIDFAMTAISAAVLPGLLSGNAWSERWNGGRLELDFNPAQQIRSVQVFRLDGSRLHRLILPAGATRLLLPADIKLSERVYLRVINGM